MKLKSNQTLVGSTVDIALIEDKKVLVKVGNMSDEGLLSFLPFNHLTQGDDIKDYLLDAYDKDDEQELLEEFLTKLKEYTDETKK